MKCFEDYQGCISRRVCSYGYEASLSHPGSGARKNTQPPISSTAFAHPLSQHVAAWLTKAGLVTGGCTGAEGGSLWRVDIFNNHRPRPRESPLLGTWNREQGLFQDQQGPGPDGNCSQINCFCHILSDLSLVSLWAFLWPWILLFALWHDATLPARLLPEQWTPRAGEVLSSRCNPEGLLFMEVL